MKVVGIIPARMKASRFPGKPLFPILGRPMIEHVVRRAQLYQGWDELVLATCDEEIASFSRSINFPVVMTGSHHTRALDRVAEAGTKLTLGLEEEDVVVCVQGDEPMMVPQMMDAITKPFREDPKIPCTVLAMHITDEAIWRNPDTVKIIHNARGEVLYTSRSPVPYCKGNFGAEIQAKRIYGIFAFRWKYLREFTNHPQTFLEQVESCDSNRILDMPFSQFIAPFPYVQSFSVDSPEDIGLVEAHMKEDSLWGKY